MFAQEAVTALVVAAGQSRRMGGQDKIMALLGGIPVLAHAVETFLRCSLVDQVVVVLAGEGVPAGRQLAQERHWPAHVRFCGGGPRRQDSVRLGLTEIAGQGWVLIHDGARPFFPLDLVQRGLEAATQTGAAIPGLVPTDTVKTVSPRGLVQKTLPRDQLRAVQTPQVFRLDVIRPAHERLATSSESFTDDAAMLESLGWPVTVFEGERHNVKITTPEDLWQAEVWWQQYGRPPGGDVV